MPGPSKATGRKNQPLGVVFASATPDGRRMNPQVIQELGVELVGRSQSEARRLVEEYFSRVNWSLENEEWERMSESQKIAFVNNARKK